MKTNELTGLTDAQVLESRRTHGANILTPPPKTPMWKKFLAKFGEPLIIVLLIAGVLSIGISFYEYFGLDEGPGVFFEPIGIFVAILLATGLSFIFEQKADKEFSLLNQVNDDEPVRVLRNGAVVQIPKKDVVVGDVVYLSTGDEVPADGTLVEAVTLTMDESSLTGEPVCHKTVDPNDFDPEATYKSNYVLRGTRVMEGHGIFIVDHVGDATENGKVFVEAQIDDSVRTPLNEQLDGLGRLISITSYAIGILIVVGRCIMYYFDPHFAGTGGFFSMHFGAYFLQSLMIAVTLVVVAVPEGLPMAVTLSLAYSMRRMLKTNNLVRKMHACETMGATTVICTDKTGTLTQNQMQVAEANFYGDTPQAIIDEGIAVNSTAMLDLSGAKPKALGNPTEGALLLYLNAQGKDYEKLREGATRVQELPFSTERKYMATIVKSAVTGKLMLYVKGAPEIVLGLCKNVAGGVSREAIANQLLGYQRQAMRTLGFAYQELTTADGVIADGTLHASDLTFEGIMAISDPVRSDVPEAVRECLDAGIDIKIVTGDTPATAGEIGRQIGLVDGTEGSNCVITGTEFAALSDEELRRRVNDFKIIARARPTDKKRLVEALQANNQVVAVTGDGTNDAPALNAAHVGLSMGDGTSVAKEASDITIVDNSFSSIGRAVMWGRSLYQNIQRFILFQMTVNVAACLIVLSGAFMGTESPLTVTQMLWVNLIMDTFAAMALASLPPSSSVMKDKPRDRRAFIITRPMWTDIIGVGGIFFLCLLGLLYIFEHSDITSLSQLCGLKLGARDSLSPYELSLFFTIFVFLQFWNMFNARAFMTGRSAFHFKGAGAFLFISVVILGGQLLIVELGGRFFNVTPLKFMDWVWIISISSLVLWIGELLRLISRMKVRAQAAAVMLLLCAAGAQAANPGTPGRFDPLLPGYLERAREAIGSVPAETIDQLEMLRTQGVALTAAQQEKYACMLAMAWFERGSHDALHLLADFCREYPAAQCAPLARMAMGDVHFFDHEWSDVLAVYNEVDADRLNADMRPLLNYRRALAMIKTGHFREARALVAELRGIKGYEDAYEFYNAYLDYIAGDFNRAYAGFSKVKKGIAGLDAPYYMTQIEYSRGQFGDVIAKGTELLRTNSAPELAPEINRIVGLSYFKTDREEQARPYLQAYFNSIEGTPAPDASYAMGAIEYADGDYAQAASRFATLTDLPDKIGQGSWLYLGLCHLRRDNATAAAMAFEKASKEAYDPQVAETALYNYVTAVTRGGKVPFSSSSELLERFVSRYPDSEYTPEVEAYLATAYYNDREYEKALRSINAIRHPSATVLGVRQKVLYQLGVEELTNGHADRAVTYLSEAASMKSTDRALAAQSSLWLGDAYSSLNRYSEAQKAYEAFIASNPTGTNKTLAYYNLGYAKYQLKNYSGAAADFARVEGGALPAAVTEDALLRRADCLYYTGKYGEAKTLFSRIAEADGANADYALYRRATLNGLAGDTKAKLADLKRIDKDFPDSRWRSNALLEMAVIYEDRGESANAADAYKKRLECVEGIDVDELLRMAAAMHKAGRAYEVLDVTARIRAAGGLEADELATIDLYEADALADLGRDNEADAIYARLALNPTSPAGSEAAVKQAEIALKQNDYTKARDLMEAFTDNGTPHQYWLARGFIALADAYKALGDKELAKEYLVSLRDNYPGSSDDIDFLISSRLKSWK